MSKKRKNPDRSDICLQTIVWILLITLIVLTGCAFRAPISNLLPIVTSFEPSTSETPFSTPTQPPETTFDTGFRFAVIGDYGTAGAALQSIAEMVISWSPDLIITTGDNNYPEGSFNSIDGNIGRYFHEYIASYTGIYGTGAEANRFFPSLGNHDWMTDNAHPYLDYFTLPGNERYYDFIQGGVHFFALDSDPHEPDGVGHSSQQAQWLKATLATSNSLWNVVFTHYPPYSSGYHGSTDWMIWPYQEWGASVVLAGHDHDYERLIVNDLPFLVIGLSGNLSYPFLQPLPDSQVRHTGNPCAIRSDATDLQLVFDLICIPKILVDSYVLQNPHHIPVE
jgi:tartrate-resistant acid phosphatase type 5